MARKKTLTKKIQEHEKKYTIILVIFFMILFAIIGYFTLKVQTPQVSSIIITN